MKKFIAIATTLTVAVVMLAGPGAAKALTSAELQAMIVSLTAQLAQLQAQLNQTTGTTGGTGNVPVACVGMTFTRSLSLGGSGNDVKCLQALLNLSSDTQVSATGAGSPGNETIYFGAKTKAAVVKFQAKKGISPTSGLVGPLTRAVLNPMLTGGTLPPPVTPPTTGGGLSVGLAYDTPVSATIADAGNGNFTKFTMTAGTEADVSVSKLYATRSGLTADADLQNIKIIDASTGGYVGSVGSLNVDHRALITFIPNLVITRGTTRTFFIRAGIVNDTTAGKTAVLSIALASDITSNASSVSGVFPITGNTMSVVSLTIGSLAIQEDGTTVDSQPDVGVKGVIINQFKLTAGSTESVTIDSITAKKSGTASISDVANFELYDVTNSKSLGAVSSWNSDEKATWGNLNLVIEKGKVVRYIIKADIVGGAGSSKTVNADLVDGTDVLVSVKGNSYGFFITPTATGSWAGTGTANQTIQNGSLNVSKSSNSPATGNVASGSDVVLGKFIFDAKGEDIKVSALSVTIAGGWNNSDITRIAVYDKNNSIVAGPKDPTALVAAFTDTFIVPTGAQEYTVKATIGDSAANGLTIYAGITTPGTTTVLTLTGMTSNNSVTATPAGTVNANTLTIAAGSLTVSTNSSPAGRSVPKGIQKFIFATFSFDAGSSGEDVQVSSITVTDSVSDAPAAAADIDNAELWADLTTGDSTRGDIYETKISNTYQWVGAAGTTANDQAFTLIPTLVVPKGTYKNIALIADLNSGAATGSHSFYITAAAKITSNGATTGTSIGETVNVANRQIFTSGSGGLTIAAEDGQLTEIVLGKARGATLAQFRLSASNVEDLKLTQLIMNVTKGNYVSTLYVYDGDKLLGQQAGIQADTQLTMANLDAINPMIIPANGSKIITVKADLNAVDGSTILNNQNIKVGLDYTNAVTTVGMGSGGSVVSAAQAAYGQNKTIFKTRPYFAKSASSPTSLNVGADTEIARFDITAGPEDDIVFSSTQSDSITFNVAAYSTSTATASITKNWSFKMDGTTYADDVEAAASNNTAKAFNSTVIFRPGYSQTNTKLVIPKGTTKMLQIFADTSDLYTVGDYIKIVLKETAGNINWSINSTTPTAAYSKGDIIFRNDIPANQLTK